MTGDYASHSLGDLSSFFIFFFFNILILWVIYTDRNARILEHRWRTPDALWDSIHYLSLCGYISICP